MASVSKASQNEAKRPEDRTEVSPPWLLVHPGQVANRICRFLSRAPRLGGSYLFFSFLPSSLEAGRIMAR